MSGEVVINLLEEEDSVIIVEQPQTVFLFVCVGFPGCGKSTFCSRLEKIAASLRIPVSVVSQDLLGSRKKCENLCRSLIKTPPAGKSIVVIDRTNIDKTQRKHWLNIASEFPAHIVHICCVVFDVDSQTCVRRAQQRVGHPTVQPQMAQVVVGRMRREFEPAKLEEGFHRLFVGTKANQLADNVIEFVVNT